MKLKNKINVVLIAILFMLSTLPILTNAGAPEKIKVIIGFNGLMQPDLIRACGGDIEHEIGIANAIATTLPKPAIEALQNNPFIDYIELDQKVYILEDTLDWGVNRIDAEIVWGGYEDAKSVSVTGNAGFGVDVMILDTGIDYHHVDLDDNYVGGYDFVNDDNDPMDDHWHGTHCAGIVGAEDNGVGVIGVAPKVNLWAVKVLDYSGAGYLSDVAAGIDWAVNHDAEVISMSLGGDSGSTTLKTACNNAYDKGVVIVAAAGNSGNPPGRGDNVKYPARYSSVIAVAATGDNDRRASFSSTGPDVELAAPGVDILSTYPGNYLATASGTSMACPHVAGVAALVIASGTTNNVDVRNQLDTTAEDLGDAGRDTHYGYGLVDAEAAAGPSPDKHDVAITAINAPGSIPQGSSTTIDVTVANEGTHAETTTVVTLTDNKDGAKIGSQIVSLAKGESTIVTFPWDTTSEALGDHILEATASVVTGETETDDNSMTTTVNVYEQGQQTDMWVSDISWRIKRAGPNVFLYHTVTVMSNDGVVSSATVSSTLNGPGGPWYFSGATDINGQVEFRLKGASSGTYTAFVTDMTHASYIYNSVHDAGNPSTSTV